MLIKVPCQFCSATAIVSCLRCAVPLCNVHEPGEGRRCATCEKTHARREVRALLAVGVPVLALELVTGLGAAAFAAVAIVAVLVGYGTTHRIRRRFLREGRPELPTAKVESL